MRTIKSRVFQEKGDRWKHGIKDDPSTDGQKSNRDSNNRRKDRKNRRNDKDAKNEPDVVEEFKILKAEKPEEVLPNNLLPVGNTTNQTKFLDKPKDDKNKKFSESRRERRASMRNQAAKEKGGESTELAEDKMQVKKENDGRKSGRDRKHFSSEQSKDKDDRRSSLESNGGGDVRQDNTTSKAERDMARIRKKVIRTKCLMF